MKRRVLISFLFVSVCLLGAIPAPAQINLPPVWPNLWVNTVDEDVAIGGFFAETYVATQNETGMITDLFVVGDSYTVFVNGLAVLTTPVVPDWTTYGCADGKEAPCPYTGNPNVAWGDLVWSQGSFALLAGDIVTIRENTLPSGYSDGTYAITATTPEPCSISLLGFGLLGLAGLRRRMKSA
jgi:hypothetical protein